jgi:GNAT superfamily N-acetyltransferase
MQRFKSFVRPTLFLLGFLFLSSKNLNAGEFPDEEEAKAEASLLATMKGVGITDLMKMDSSKCASSGQPPRDFSKSLEKKAAAVDELGAEEFISPERKFLINSFNCAPKEYIQANLEATLDQWIDLSPKDDRTRVNLLNHMLESVQFFDRREDLKSFFILVCDKDGKIYSVASYDLEGQQDYSIINHLVTHPQLEGKGGGTAILRQAIERALRNQKKGLALIPTQKAEQFYRNRGFVSYNPDNTEEIDVFDYLGREQLLKSFPEMSKFQN